jgi:hypothetical protein
VGAERSREPGEGAEAPARRATVARSAETVPAQAQVPLSLQRRAGNRAVSGLVERLAVQRKVAASTTPGVGPKAEILDSALSGTSGTRAAECLTLADAGTAFDDHPWVKARAAANSGKVPNSVKKGFKWKWPHRNNDGHLPGTPGAGGYDEYYIMNAKNDGPADAERLVISADTKNVFHTATHYGDKGPPAFTHYKAR